VVGGGECRGKEEEDGRGEGIHRGMIGIGEE
jgi:hypothetical protein